MKGGDLSTWYDADFAEIKKAYPFFFRKYHFNWYKMLKTVYSDYNWEPWRFKKAPKNLYKDPMVMERILSEIERAFQIDSPEHWYRVSHSQLSNIGFISFIRRHGSLYEVLKMYRPNVDWDPKRFSL